MTVKRRSKRLPLRIPVRVYGRTADNRPFRDHTETETVSAHGGLIALKRSLNQGQSLLVVNSLTDEERECRVVYVEPKGRGNRRIGVEFTRPEGNFWHVYGSLILPGKPAESEPIPAVPAK
jgi:hypothetical protein